MTTSDLELLQQFARDRSEDAFATLVKRHVDLVYSAAVRQVCSSQLAEDVSQSVFLDLSRNAEKLKPDTILTAWLYRVTRRTAIDVVRSESRRQLREQIAVELADMNSSDAHWDTIAPLLDEAMETLDEEERSSILLRYFENKSLREVGKTLGTSDDAAQKRVSRAVDQLREFFSKRGLTVCASGLAVVISANAVQAAPIGFALTISSAFGGTTLASATTATAIKTIAMTTLQKSLITAIVVAAVGVGIYEAREASTLRTRVQLLEQQQQSAPADQLQQVTRERDDVKRELAELRQENERLKSNSAELIKLRGEVARLRNETRQLALTKDVTNDSAGGWTGDGIRWRPEWKDAGLKSPEDAIGTYCWALVNNRIGRLKDCLAFDRSTNTSPVSEIYAKREVRSDGDKWRAAALGGVRFHRVYSGILPDRARIEVEIMNPPAEGSVDPANPPAWNPWSNETLDFVKVNNEWKIARQENLLRLTTDDDSEEIAKRMMQMDPKTLEQLKSDPRLPLRTLRAYEELKAKAAK